MTQIEQQIFEKMKAKDFGESMCNETKLNVLKWTMQQLRKHDVVGRSEQCAHPRDKREYIGSNMLRCKVCGKEFS